MLVSVGPNPFIIYVAKPITLCVVPPTTMSDPEDAYEIVVPETVITPPGVSVCPAMIKSEAASAVYVEPPKVIISTVSVPFTEAKVSVELPMTAIVALESREIGVPDIVITPLGVRVCPAMIKSEAASAVYVDPPKVISLVVPVSFVDANVSVELPIIAIAALGPREMGVPETVITPPGVRVCPAITKLVAVSAV